MKRLIHIFMLICLLGAVASATGAVAQSTIEYERFDVNINILPDGRFVVQEIQQIQFGGEFTSGFAEIPLTYTSAIEDVSVSGGPSLTEQTAYLKGSGAQTFSTSLEGQTLFVDWEFAPTSPGDTLIFVLQYTVQGGLWVYPEMTRLEWRAIAADRSGLDVPQSQVTVTLPAVVDAAALDADAFGPNQTINIVENETSTTIIYEIAEAMVDGTAFQVLLDFPPGLVTAVPQPWQIAEDNARLKYRIDQIDMEISVQPDGTLHVVETQQVSVQLGILYSGFRQFSLLFSDGIQVLGVREGDLSLSEADFGSTCVDCYTVAEKSTFSWWASYSEVSDEVVINEEAAGEMFLTWFVPPLVAGESMQFTLEYNVLGAVRPDETHQELNWTAVSNHDVSIENVQVRWLLPNGLGLEDVQFSGGTVSQTADGAIVVTNDAPIAPNSSWQIGLTLPPNGTSASVPIWQRKIDAEIAEGEAFRVRQARIDLAWLLGKVMLGLTAVLGAITYWYLQGSRRLREAQGNYRTEPPSSLPPGVVNFLVEGKMTARGVLASVLHLADLGLFRLHMGDPLKLTAVRQEPLPANSKIVTLGGDEVVVSRFLSQLFNGLLPHLPGGTAVPLPTLLQTLPNQLPQLTKTMGEEMVDYFYGRKAWRAKYGQSIIVFSMFAIFVFIVIVFTNGLQYRWGVPIPVFLFGGMLLWFFIASRLSGGRRSLTDQAKMEASHWIGFKRYLSEIQQFGNLAEAQEILDRYFAYAVALGVDERLLAQIKKLGGHAPGWLQNSETALPYPARQHSWQDRWQRRLHRGSWRPQPPKPDLSAAPPQVENGRPPLETLSDNLVGGLERSSNQLADLLNTAVGLPKDGTATDIVLNAAGQSVKLNWDNDQSLDRMMNNIMSKAQSIKPPRPSSGGGRGGYRGRSGSSFSRSSRRSSSSRSRSSSSRRSGGGGRRGFK